MVYGRLPNFVSSQGVDAKNHSMERFVVVTQFKISKLPTSESAIPSFWRPNFVSNLNFDHGFEISMKSYTNSIPSIHM